VYPCFKTNDILGNENITEFYPEGEDMIFKWKCKSPTIVHIGTLIKAVIMMAAAYRMTFSTMQAIARRWETHSSFLLCMLWERKEQAFQ
ncbi:hypothetical protein STEG23_024013, partial [Scotinomys teguina]